ADNCSSTGYVMGDWQKLDREITDLKMDLIVNNVVVESASSSAILENPLQSVVELSRLASGAGLTVKKGHIILAGAATAAQFLEKEKQVAVQIEKLGEVGFRTK
ncbi:MAG: fumarylacetoacetate hydrolase family protein, partial [Flavobacteriales bacterium]|nr:fumarylacetoacetate hydrolase family protein [Flavobacteriales bacterium]